MEPHILFPAKYRVIAYVLFAVVLITSVSVKSFNLFQNDVLTKDFVRSIVDGLLCLGLFLTVFSKYPDDDEMLMEIRLKLIQYSLFVGLFFLLFSPVVDYLSGDTSINKIGASQFLLTILIYQNILFQWKRYQLKKELNEE